MASASANLSGQSGSPPPPPPPHGDAMEIAAAGAANPPPTEPKPSSASFHHQPIPPPPAAAGAAGRQDTKGYTVTCKRCAMWFWNHQGLGSHKNRELAAAAGGGGEPATPQQAGEAARARRVRRRVPLGGSGVQLGGHKRKHWTGPSIVSKKKKKPRVAVAAHGNRRGPRAGAAGQSGRRGSTCGTAGCRGAGAADGGENTRAPSLHLGRRRRAECFYSAFTSGRRVQTTEAQEGSPPATESSASTGGQQ
ncbi:unnamed protein product [Urochloa humidicola]